MIYAEWCSPGWSTVMIICSKGTLYFPLSILHALCSPCLSKQLCSYCFRAKFLYNLYKILLHEIFFHFIFNLFNHLIISIWNHGYSLYTSGYNPKLFYFIFQIFHLAPVPLCYVHINVIFFYRFLNFLALQDSPDPGSSCIFPATSISTRNSVSF